MKNRIIVARYAQALLEVAQRNNQVDQILKEIEIFSRYWQKNDQIRGFLKSPHFTKDQKKQYIKRFFTSYFTDILLNFLYILVDKNRLNYLPQMCNKYKELSYEFKGMEEVRVISVHPINKPLLDRLENRIQQLVNKGIELEVEINPDILGGVTVHFKDQVIDGSLRHNLKQLKERLYQTSVP